MKYCSLHGYLIYIYGDQPNMCAFTDTFIKPNGSDQRNLNKAMCKVEVEQLFGDKTFWKL